MSGSAVKSIKISRESVHNTRIEHLAEYVPFSGEDHLFSLPAGETEYRLYAYISDLFNNVTILDIGTRNGNSAVALSSNPLNKVISYDIIETDAFRNLNKENIQMVIANFHHENIDLSNVPIIMIDVDPHDGSQERGMFEYLKSVNWEGIVILDDTRKDLWPAIAKFIDDIRNEYVVHDVTDIGHFSGTAIIEFGDKYKIEVVN